ncbi:MAG: hypothetical protein JWO97_1548 [Acidobacteria bacterium]|nr:hypothetical protein [Acidobacteriota bacterium]
MNSRKTILVIGATGAQGGSVVRALLERGSFNVRAFTRKPDSPAALELASRGVELAVGDLDDRDSIAAALDGVHGVFGVTNFWEHFEKEGEEGRNLVRAVADANVQHFVFSTLPAVEKATGGALHSPHFDIKAELEEYARALSIPATFIHMPMYYESFTSLLRPEGDAFTLRIPLGTTPLAMMAVSDLGFIVARVFEQRDAFIGKTLALAAEELPVARYAELLSGVIDADVRYEHLPRETFASLGFPGAADFADMFEFYRAHMPSRAESIATWRAIAPELQQFETWAVRNQQKLRLALGVRETVGA